MPRFAMKIEYHGGPFAGWQRQKDVPSVQEAVENALQVHRDYVMNETLATTWETGQSDPRFTADREMGEDAWKIEISL